MLLTVLFLLFRATVQAEERSTCSMRFRNLHASWREYSAVVSARPPDTDGVWIVWEIEMTHTSKSNVISDVTQTLQRFDLIDLQQYTREGTYSSTASKDFHLFYVGRDDVHDILKHILSRASVSLYLNMFGFDDDELNDILMQQALDPSITMMITLDKSQANGIHEKKLIESDIARNPTKFNTYFVIGQSATHQISHTKGFVADGKVGGEGSTNWSASGEGTFVVKGKPGGPGYKAQNNTQSIFTDPDTINRFQTELIAEHMTAKGQRTSAAGVIAAKATPLRVPKGVRLARQPTHPSLRIGG